MHSLLNQTLVLIPAYNEAATIRDLVRRTLAMTPTVVVVDDGSTDATSEKLTGLPVAILRNEHNLTLTFYDPDFFRPPFNLRTLCEWWFRRAAR